MSLKKKFDWSKYMWLFMLQDLCEYTKLNMNEAEEYNYVGALNILSANKLREKHLNGK